MVKGEWRFVVFCWFMCLFVCFGGDDKRYYLCFMKAIKYDKVNELPKHALKVSTYAEVNNIPQPAYVCIKYDRYLIGKGSYPGYKIVNWQGFNFVIPD